MINIDFNYSISILDPPSLIKLINSYYYKNYPYKISNRIKNHYNQIQIPFLSIKLKRFMQLPIKQYKKQILYSIQNNDIVLITAQTGSGKTTQLPQFLIQAGYTLQNKKIATVLPRKIAALSISKRISYEMGLNNGQIAHQVRFDSTINQKTKVILMTDGILVQKLYQDPLLSQFSVIILDDIHEKSINYQILFGFLKIILRKRKDLKIIITSATTQDQSIRMFFQRKKKQIIMSQEEERSLKFKQTNVTGRLYSVKIHYLKQPSKNYFLKIFQTIIYIDRQTRSVGNILVFLTSIQQIQGMANLLDSYQYENKKKFNVLPLHSFLSNQDQNKIFQPSVDRKIILSTNIAQSSITIPDIQFVIDCGYVKCKVYDPFSGSQKMVVIPCGKNSCSQRSGRAGRVSNGQCFRIFTQQAYQRMTQKIPSQILRIDLSNFILKLKGLGIQDLYNFQFIQQPPQFNMIKAIDTLYAFQLIKQDFSLTQKGKRVSQLSLDFKNSCCLMNSFDSKFGCSKQILMLASMLQVNRDLFSSRGLSIIKTKKKFGAKEGDFLTLINIFLKFYNAKHYQKKKVCGDMKVRYNTMQHATKIYHQLQSQIKSFNRFKNEMEIMNYKYGEKQGQRKTLYQIKSSADVHQTILRCIFSGYFMNIAQLQSDMSYRNIRSSDKLIIHPSSIISVTYPEWIIYHQVIKTTQGNFIHNASQIYSEWIFQLAGHYYKDKRAQKVQKSYENQMEIQRQVFMPEVKKNDKMESGLVRIGGQKKKTQIFKTQVLGLKDKKVKNTKLSFQDDII